MIEPVETVKPSQPQLPAAQFPTAATVPPGALDPRMRYRFGFRSRRVRPTIPMELPTYQVPARRPFYKARSRKVRKHPRFPGLSRRGYVMPFYSPGLEAQWNENGELAGLLSKIKKIVKKVSYGIPKKIVKKVVKHRKKILIAGAVAASIYFGGPAALALIKSVSAKAAIKGIAAKTVLKKIYKVGKAGVKAYVAVKGAQAQPGSVAYQGQDYSTGLVQYVPGYVPGQVGTGTAAPITVQQYGDPYSPTAQMPVMTAGLGSMGLPLLIGGGLLMLVMSSRGGGRKRRLR